MKLSSCEETMVEHALTVQTSAKMNSTLSYDNEGFIFDLFSFSYCITLNFHILEDPGTHLNGKE